MARRISHRWLFRKPQTTQPFDYLSHMPKMAIRAVLQKNIERRQRALEQPLGQRAFAKRFGVGEGTVSRARRGDGNTTLETLAVLAAAYRCEPWELLLPPPAATSGTPRSTSAEANEGTPAVDAGANGTADELWEQIPMELKRELRELFTAYMALPENERDDFKRQIEISSMRYRRRTRDEALAHLAAPKERPAESVKAGVHRKGKGTQ